MTQRRRPGAEGYPGTPDDIDRDVIATKSPVGRFVGHTYRYSIPIILGVTSGTDQDSCYGCHRALFHEENGDVMAVFSSSLDTAAARRSSTGGCGGLSLAAL